MRKACVVGVGEVDSKCSKAIPSARPSATADATTMTKAASTNIILLEWVNVGTCNRECISYRESKAIKPNSPEKLTPACCEAGAMQMQMIQWHRGCRERRDWSDTRRFEPQSRVHKQRRRRAPLGMGRRFVQNAKRKEQARDKLCTGIAHDSFEQPGWGEWCSNGVNVVRDKIELRQREDEGNDCKRECGSL